MKRYQFRLDTVLRVRRAQEEAARGQLAHANVALRAAIGARDHAQTRYADLTAAETVPADLSGLLANRLLSGLRADATARAQAAAMAAAAQAAAAQAQWSVAARQVAILERLDQRRRAEHTAQALRAEIVGVDDLVTARWGTGDDGLPSGGTAYGGPRPVPASPAAPAPRGAQVAAREPELADEALVGASS